MTSVFVFLGVAGVAIAYAGVAEWLRDRKRRRWIAEREAWERYSEGHRLP